LNKNKPATLLIAEKEVFIKINMQHLGRELCWQRVKIKTINFDYLSSNLTVGYFAFHFVFDGRFQIAFLSVAAD
jgi:hypothetical protein